MSEPHHHPGRMKVKRALAIAALALLAATMIALFWKPLGSKSPGASRTPLVVSRTNLVLLAGHLCLSGQTNAFTGIMLEHSADGSLRSRSSIANGLLHGLSEGWHTNGQLQVSEHFKEGISQGLRTKWYPNGVKLSEGQIVGGKFHGTFRRWSESGSLAEQVEFMDGQPQGVALAYFESGFLKTWARLKDGKVIDQKSWSDHQQRQPLPD